MHAARRRPRLRRRSSRDSDDAVRGKRGEDDAEREHARPPPAVLRNPRLEWRRRARRARDRKRRSDAPGRSPGPPRASATPSSRLDGAARPTCARARRHRACSRCRRAASCVRRVCARVCVSPLRSADASASSRRAKAAAARVPACACRPQPVRRRDIEVARASTSADAGGRKHGARAALLVAEAAARRRRPSPTITGTDAVPSRAALRALRALRARGAADARAARAPRHAPRRPPANALGASGALLVAFGALCRARPRDLEADGPLDESAGAALRARSTPPRSPSRPGGCRKFAARRRAPRARRRGRRALDRARGARGELRPARRRRRELASPSAADARRRQRTRARAGGNCRRRRTNCRRTVNGALAEDASPPACRFERGPLRPPRRGRTVPTRRRRLPLTSVGVREARRAPARATGRGGAATRRRRRRRRRRPRLRTGVGALDAERGEPPGEARLEPARRVARATRRRSGRRPRDRGSSFEPPASTCSTDLRRRWSHAAGDAADDDDADDDDPSALADPGDLRRRAKIDRARSGRGRLPLRRRRRAAPRSRAPSAPSRASALNTVRDVARRHRRVDARRQQPPKPRARVRDGDAGPVCRRETRRRGDPRVARGAPRL